MKTVNNSAVYAVLSNIRLSHAERAAAVAALQDGEKIAETIVQIAHYLRLLVSVPALKPNFKAQ